MAACSALAIAEPLFEPPSAKGFAAAMILIGGVAETVIGLFGAQIERSRTDVTLGLLSLAFASALTLIPADDAFLLTAFLTMWLVARGVTELAGGVRAADWRGAAAAVRLSRGAIDLVLGLLSLIGTLTTIWGQEIFGWPAAIVSTILLFAALSLMAAGLLHFGLAVGHGGRSASAR